MKGFKLMSGLGVARWSIVTEHKDLFKFKFPYFLKADLPGHKTESYAVLECHDLKHAEESLKWIHEKFPDFYDKYMKSVGEQFNASFTLMTTRLADIHLT